MAAQEVPGFLANLIQGTVIEERAKFRVLDPKSGKRFNVKIKEKRPKWYQLFFNWWLRKLHIRKRNHYYFHTFSEPYQDALAYENEDDFYDPGDLLRREYAEDSIYVNYTSDPDQRGETEVTVHRTPDTSDDGFQHYYSSPPSERKTSDKPRENDYKSEIINSIKAGSDGSFVDRPRPPPRNKKAEGSTRVETQLQFGMVNDMINPIVVNTPGSEYPSRDNDDYYEHKMNEKYQQLFCHPCNH